MPKKRSKEPSNACKEAAMVLLAPPPEFKAVMALLRQNTTLLEQTADTLDQLVVLITASKSFPSKSKRAQRPSRKTAKSKPTNV